jgi:hypothetical protein
MQQVRVPLPAAQAAELNQYNQTSAQAGDKIMWNIAEISRHLEKFTKGDSPFRFILDSCKNELREKTIITGEGKYRRYYVNAEWFEAFRKLHPQSWIMSAYDEWQASIAPAPAPAIETVETVETVQDFELVPAATSANTVTEIHTVTIHDYNDMSESLQYQVPVTTRVYPEREQVRSLLTGLIPVVVELPELTADAQVFRGKTGADEFTTIWQIGDLTIKQVSGDMGGMPQAYAQPGKYPPAERSFF